MSKRDDGGPAFPVGPQQYDNDMNPFWDRSEGMTLRDYFAAHASDGDVQSVMEEMGHTGALVGLDMAGRIAAARGAVADAMLAERAK